MALLLATAGAAPAQDDPTTEARALRKSGRLDAAVDALAAARRDAPADAEVAGLLGLCLLDAGRLDEARALAEEATLLEGSYGGGVFLGRLALATGDVEGAVERLQDAVERSDRPVEGLVALVRAHAAANETVRAAVVAERLEAHHEVLGRRLGAEMLAATGDRILTRGDRNAEALPRALEKYEESLAKTPDDDLLARKVYDTLVRNQRPEEARAYLDRLFPVEADPVERRWQEGRCQVVAGEMDAAEASFRAVLADAPERAEAACELARILLERGRTDEVDAVLAPFVDASDASVHLLVGMAAERRGDLAAAETSLRRAVELAPSAPEGLYHLGRVLVRTGKRDEGRELLERFRRTDG